MADEPEDPPPRAPPALNYLCGELGELIMNYLPPGTGFVMVMFDSRAGVESMAYASNADRQGVIRTLNDLRRKLRALG